MNRLQEPARLPGTAQPQNVSRETFGRAGRARPPKRALTVPLQFNDPPGFRLAEKSAARDSTNLSASSQFPKIPAAEAARFTSSISGRHVRLLSYAFYRKIRIPVIPGPRFLEWRGIRGSRSRSPLPLKRKQRNGANLPPQHKHHLARELVFRFIFCRSGPGGRWSRSPLAVYDQREHRPRAARAVQPQTSRRR